MSVSLKRCCELWFLSKRILSSERNGKIQKIIPQTFFLTNLRKNLQIKVSFKKAYSVAQNQSCQVAINRSEVIFRERKELECLGCIFKAIFFFFLSVKLVASLCDVFICLSIFDTIFRSLYVNNWNLLFRSVLHCLKFYHAILNRLRICRDKRRKINLTISIIPVL